MNLKEHSLPGYMKRDHIWTVINKQERHKDKNNYSANSNVHLQKKKFKFKGIYEKILVIYVKGFLQIAL